MLRRERRLAPRSSERRLPPRSSVRFADTLVGRDPSHDRALEAEIYAQAGGRLDEDAIRVAADAWEEAGDANRARFLLMQLWTPRPVSTQIYQTIKSAIQAWTKWQEDFHAQHGRWPTEEERQARGDLFSAPEDWTGASYYEFLLEAPTRTRFELDRETGNRAFLSSIFGSSFAGNAVPGGAFRAYGGRGAPNRFYVTVEAVNGFLYKGTCSNTGDCWVGRGPLWIDPHTGKRLKRRSR